jgi:PAS domain S-box-containing protein
VSVLPDPKFIQGITEALADRFEAPAFALRIEDDMVVLLASSRDEGVWNADAERAVLERAATPGFEPLVPELVVGKTTLVFTTIPGDASLALCVVPLDGAPPPASRLRLLAQFAGVAAKRMGVAPAPKTPAAGKPAAPASSEAAAKPASSASLQSRYQRLLLLNRIALGMFSGPSLEDSLERAAHGILALSGAKFILLYRRDETDALSPAFYLGDSQFLGERADQGLQDAVSRLRLDPEPVWISAPPAAWYVRGVSARSSKRLDGILALGFLKAERPDNNVETLLGDVCGLLHNAFRAERQLREQETLAAVTEQSADPILITDLEGRITAWSRGAEETFGFSVEEAVQQDFNALLVPEEHLEAAKASEREALKTGSLRGAESRRRRRDGGLIDVEATYTLVQDDAGKPFGMVRILRDITRRKELERMREEFIALITHDLRIPLTSIRGFSDTMVEYWDDLAEEEKKKYTGVILRESKRMGRLVDDFLDLSRYESGSMEHDTTAVELKPLFARVVETLEGFGGGVRFTTEIAKSLGAIEADGDQLERVLINLGGNAVKYSPDGGTVRLEAADEGDGILFTVADEGPGIPEEAQKKLFDKFYRASDEISKKKKGTGLGLTVCKYITEAHGGRIWVESRLGEGSRFRFLLPKFASGFSK